MRYTKISMLALSVLLVGAGCAQVELPNPIAPLLPEKETESAVVLPVANYKEDRTFKVFGQRVQDRFTGYHVGDDIEAAHITEEVPVVAIANGTVRRIGFVGGYGGLIIIDHDIEERKIQALYGHIDLASSSLKAGDAVTKGQFLANLGDHKSRETDGERKHLHFALRIGNDIVLRGYESTLQGVAQWINPSEFFEEYGL